MDDGGSLILLSSFWGAVFDFVSQFSVEEATDDALSSPFQFLDNADGCFEVGVKSDCIGHDLYFFSDSHIFLDGFDSLVPFTGGHVVTRQWNGKCFRGHLEFHEDVVEVDIVCLGVGCMGGVSDDILFEFAHPDDDVVEHLLHEDTFLGVNHLVEGVF